MNKSKFLVVCSVALAAGISFAGLVDFDKLNLNQADKFETPLTKVEVTGAAAETYATDNKYTLDGELTDAEAALIVRPSVSMQDIEIEKFTLTFNVGFTDTLPAYSDAAIGFAFKAANKATYWNGAEWKEIALTTSVTEEAETTVHVEYDARATSAQTTEQKTAQVRFTIAGVKYGWYEVRTIGSNVVKAFGAGIVTSIAGTTHTITSEIVPVTPSGEGEKKIEFTPTQIAALEEAGVDFSEPTELNKVQDNGQTKLTNYILFGKAKDAEITAADMPKAVGEPKAKVAGNVAVKVSGLNVQEVEGTQVKYVLMGSVTGEKDTWHQIGEAQTADTLEFENTTSDRYFKVRAVIEYTTPANTPAN